MQVCTGTYEQTHTNRHTHSYSFIHIAEIEKTGKGIVMLPAWII